MNFFFLPVRSRSFLLLSGKVCYKRFSFLWLILTSKVKMHGPPDLIEGNGRLFSYSIMRERFLFACI